MKLISFKCGLKFRCSNLETRRKENLRTQTCAHTVGGRGGLWGGVGVRGGSKAMIKGDTKNSIDLNPFHASLCRCPSLCWDSTIYIKRCLLSEGQLLDPPLSARNADSEPTTVITRSVCCIHNCLLVYLHYSPSSVI